MWAAPTPTPPTAHTRGERRRYFLLGGYRSLMWLFWQGAYDHLGRGSRRWRLTVACACVYVAGVFAQMLWPQHHLPWWLRISEALLFVPVTIIALGELWRGIYLRWRARWRLRSAVARQRADSNRV
jgi:hypothetical protein